MTEQPSGADALGYRVLARKYRPQTFADLIGQEAMVRTLTNAFATGRIAQAYMLTGVRGVGKTTTARLIARALNYGDAPTTDMPAFGPHCEAILESRHMDVIEMDAASNTGVDDVREIIEAARYKPLSARTKVYIVDEVHMLSKNAFNALLKTLEEPPPHVKFVFATTEIRKVPVTILSRCQRFDLRRIDAALLIEHYRKIAALESANVEEEALRLIARAAEGSVRDGLSLLDRAIAHGEGKVTAAEVQAMLGLADRSAIIGLFDAVMAGDAARALRDIEARHADGSDPHTILVDLADFVHWVTRLKVVPEAASDPARTEVERTRGQDYAKQVGMAHLARAWQMLLKGLKEVETHADPLIAAEMLLIRLAYAAELPPPGELARIAQSEPASPARPPLPPRPASNGPLAVQSQPAPDLPQSALAPPPITMAGIVALAAEKRDIRLKSDLERLVRPIKIAPGRIELALEPNAPPSLPSELARKLEGWTGMRWIVSLAKDGGAAPLAQQERSARDRREQEARDHPTVKAVLDRWPDAKIVAVRDPQPAPETSDNDKDDLA
jgi:DNA polymerase-3 subunit gamma/tau